MSNPLPLLSLNQLQISESESDDDEVEEDLLDDINKDTHVVKCVHKWTIAHFSLLCGDGMYSAPVRSTMFELPNGFECYLELFHYNIPEAVEFGLENEELRVIFESTSASCRPIGVSIKVSYVDGNDQKCFIKELTHTYCAPLMKTTDLLARSAQMLPDNKLTLYFEMEFRFEDWIAKEAKKRATKLMLFNEPFEPEPVSWIPQIDTLTAGIAFTSRHTWTVDNFVERYLNRQEVLKEKQNFSDGSKKFKFELYLAARSQVNDGLVLCLKIVNWGDKKMVLTEYTLSVIGRDKVAHKSELYRRSFTTSSWKTNYLTRDALLANADQLIPDGKLTVCIEMKVLNYEDIKSSCKSNDRLIEIPKCQLASDFGDLFQSGDLSDVTIRVGGGQSEGGTIIPIREFKAHKAILGARSPVFRAMFTHSLSENTTNIVNITDCDEPDAFHQLLKYIYTGKLDKFELYALQVSQLAEKYLLDELNSKCKRFLALKSN